MISPPTHTHTLTYHPSRPDAKHWRLSTVRVRGEAAQGVWTLTLRDRRYNENVRITGRARVRISGRIRFGLGLRGEVRVTARATVSF